MEKVKSILQKIENISTADSFSSIEKDLLLQYTRDLYEAVLGMQFSEVKTETPIENIAQILTEEPEPDVAIVESELAKTTADSMVVVNNNLSEENTFEEDNSADFIEEEDDLQLENDDIKFSINEPPFENENNDFNDSSVEETHAEKMMFELEPELRGDVTMRNAINKLNDFKVWNRDIRSYIGINDKYNFISVLFQNNNEAYEEILNEINVCETKEEALQFLENSGITTLYKWTENGFSEQIFYNVLSQFFASR